MRHSDLERNNVGQCSKQGPPLPVPHPLHTKDKVHQQEYPEPREYAIERVGLRGHVTQQSARERGPEPRGHWADPGLEDIHGISLGLRLVLPVKEMVDQLLDLLSAPPNPTWVGDCRFIISTCSVCSKALDLIPST